jgi:hypothetical protein
VEKQHHSRGSHFSPLSLSLSTSLHLKHLSPCLQVGHIYIDLRCKLTKYTGDVSLQPPTDGISSLAWSPDSSRLLVASWDSVCPIHPKSASALTPSSPSHYIPSPRHLLSQRCTFVAVNEESADKPTSQLFPSCACSSRGFRLGRGRCVLWRSGQAG